MYQGTRHGIGYYLHKQSLKRIENHGLQWPLPFSQCALEPLPISTTLVERMRKRTTENIF